MRAVIACVVLVAVVPRNAIAEVLRLRADALSAAADSIGVMSLQADAEFVPWLRAEAVVWIGAGDIGDDRLGGDALIINVEARAANGSATARLGRMVATVGALRPLHFDGLWARASLPWRWQVEGFAGVPVAPGMMARSFDWLAGARLARRLGDYGSVGVAYLHQRDYGQLAGEELAFDAGAAVGRRADVGARLALDLIRFGVAEARLHAAHRHGSWRTEVYVSERHASHLLPATSLFSVLGDVAAQRAGAVVSWRAAPRLEVTSELSAQRLGDSFDVEAVLRSRLFLGDRRTTSRAGAPQVGSIGLELHRSGAVLGGWTGARVSARVPVRGAWTAASELELVVPDLRDRGAIWPWALASISWQHQQWQAAIAVEASASAELSQRVDVLARLARSWEGL